MHIGYTENFVAYRFLALKSDVLDWNTIIERTDAGFFEHFHCIIKLLMHMLKEIMRIPLILRNCEGAKARK